MCNSTISGGAVDDLDSKRSKNRWFISNITIALPENLIIISYTLARFYSCSDVKNSHRGRNEEQYEHLWRKLLIFVTKLLKTTEDSNPMNINSLSRLKQTKRLYSLKWQLNLLLLISKEFDRHISSSKIARVVVIDY